jgi:hypothetical protein
MLVLGQENVARLVRKLVEICNPGAASGIRSIEVDPPEAIIRHRQARHIILPHLSAKALLIETKRKDDSVPALLVDKWQDWHVHLGLRENGKNIAQQLLVANQMS